MATSADVSELLTRAYSAHPVTAAAYLRAVSQTRRLDQDPDAALTWTVPDLPRVPARVALSFTAGFEAYRKAHDLTAHMALERLGAELARGGALSPAAARWAERMGLSEQDAAASLDALLAGLGDEAWGRLLALLHDG